MKRALPLLFLLACKPESAKIAPAPAAAPVAVHEAPAGEPAPGTVTAPPAEALAPTEEAATEAVTGVVLETAPAGKYLYLKLKRETGAEEWAAILLTDVKVGASVTIRSPFLKHDFDSPTLNRRFDRIWFGTLGGSPKAPVTAEPHAVVAAPSGGTAIATLRKDRASFSGKIVTVRGKVTKYNEAILGKNWLHVADGSATDGSDDIAVTTTGTTTVGATVTIKGKAGVDRDFGGGYSYDVIIEEAEVTAE